MQLGAYEYLLKPLELDQLLDLADRAFEISRLMKTPAVISEGPADTDSSDALVGRCPAMQAVYKSIGRVASQDVTVLILGESGTGKELVARAIYQYSRRAKAAFLAINCAAIPESLLESELFGHEKGAFTGADRKRIGKFEQCNGGTLFLDEIGDMSALTQTKILRVLQGQEFERIGGNEPIKSDVRVITATNRDLEKMVGEGTFRGDLYYRLNVFTIRLPALRERGEDIPLLAEHFVKRFARDLRKNVQTIADESLELLKRYSWPGNVREFQSVIKQALLQATGPVLLPEFLPESIRGRPETLQGTRLLGDGPARLVGFCPAAATRGLHVALRGLPGNHRSTCLDACAYAHRGQSFWGSQDSRHHACHAANEAQRAGVVHRSSGVHEPTRLRLVNAVCLQSARQFTYHSRFSSPTFAGPVMTAPKGSKWDP